MDYMIFIYLLLVGCIVIFFRMWRLDKTVKTKRLVLLQSTSGRGEYLLVDKSPNDISIQTIEKGKDGKEEVVTKTWALTEFNIMTIPYPQGSGASFLKRDIEYVEISERDWNPITNISPNRDVIASPVFLGNLINEKVTSAIVTMGKDVVDAIKGIGKILNPNHFYLFMIVLVGGIGFTIYLLMPVVDKMNDIIIRFPEIITKIDMVIKALGLE